MNPFENKLINSLIEWGEGKKKPPLIVSFRVTRGCDLKCRFCAVHDPSELKKELKIEDYKKLINELCDLGVKYCALIGGGEALYKKKLTLQIIALVKKKGMTCWLVTNGFNLDEKTIKHLVSIGFDTILFSIDGSNKKTHNHLRGVDGAFERTIKNIELFNYWKTRLEKKKPELKIQTLILKDNYNEIEDILNLVKKLNIKSLIINYLVPQFEREKKFLLNKKEEAKLNRKLKELLKNKENEKITNFKDYLKVKKLIKKRYNTNSKKDLISAYCFQPWYHLNISEFGHINVCPEINKGDRKKISISKESIKDVWFGQYLEGFRKTILNKKLLKHCQKYCNFPIAIENLKISNLLEDEYRRRKNK